MQQIEQSYTSLIEVNRSKFITHIVPIATYEGLQAKLKSQHPKANHVVYAVRYLNEFDQIIENSSDDGEPKGCAGTPILNVLRGEALINCAILIVRYFGGIKLGTGGMVRAYTQAAKEGLATATLLPYVKLIEHTFITSYQEIDKTLYHLKQLDITHYERSFNTHDVTWRILASQEKIAQL